MDKLKKILGREPTADEVKFYNNNQRYRIGFKKDRNGKLTTYNECCECFEEVYAWERCHHHYNQAQVCS